MIATYARTLLHFVGHFSPLSGIEVQMADDKGNRGPADRSRVNVNEDYEVRYWCGEFGCTEAELRAAVSAVGTSAANVRAHLAASR